MADEKRKLRREFEAEVEGLRRKQNADVTTLREKQKEQVREMRIAVKIRLVFIRSLQLWYDVVNRMRH